MDLIGFRKMILLSYLKNHKGFIDRIATKYTNNREDKEDLIQEINFQLFKSINTYSNKSKLSTWAYRVVINTAIRYFKERFKYTSNCVISPDPSIYMSNIVGIGNDNEYIFILQHSLKVLNENELSIVKFYLMGLSHKEISAIVNISISNVSTIIYRAKIKLKNAIKTREYKRMIKRIA